MAQLGLHSKCLDVTLDHKRRVASAKIHLQAYGRIASLLLEQLPTGTYIGKLFAAVPGRRVRDPDYLMRMFGRTDREGRPLLSLGGPHGRDKLLLEKIDGRTVAWLQLLKGTISYDEKAIIGLIPTIIKILQQPASWLRSLVQLDQVWQENGKRIVHENEILLVRTEPLHVRTVFGKVVDELLPKGYYHTSANILPPPLKPPATSMNFLAQPAKRSPKCL